MRLITMQVANLHLRLGMDVGSSPVDDERYDDLVAKVEQASDLVLDYLKKANGDSPGWDETSTPKLVQAAVCLILYDLWNNRGGGDGDYFKVDGPVYRCLARYRDPALA